LPNRSLNSRGQFPEIMKTDDLQALAGLDKADFRALEPTLQALDKHLTLRTYLDGYALSAQDTRIWQDLRANRAAVSFIKKASLANLARWYTYIETNHPDIQAEIKSKEAAAKAKVAAGSKGGANYALALQDADKGIVTRFLPEPS
jgi:glutamyl-tRNA synthetase